MVIDHKIACLYRVATLYNHKNKCIGHQSPSHCNPYSATIVHYSNIDTSALFYTKSNRKSSITLLVVKNLPAAFKLLLSSSY